MNDGQNYNVAKSLADAVNDKQHRRVINFSYRLPRIVTDEQENELAEIAKTHDFTFQLERLPSGETNVKIFNMPMDIEISL